MREEYGRVDKTEMGIWECIELLNEFIDDSDPDLDMPQIEHLLQTAEAIRKDFPDEDWLHLTGLIHGKLNYFITATKTVTVIAHPPRRRNELIGRPHMIHRVGFVGVRAGTIAGY